MVSLFRKRRPSPRDLYRAYCDGLPGSPADHALGERLIERGVALPGSSPRAGSIQGLHRQHKRALLFKALRRLDPPKKGAPGAYADESQTEPDCTSHGSRNGFDTTRAVEIVSQGSGEQFIVRGSTEMIYAGRGSAGGGMSPQKATLILAKGQLLRRDYTAEGGPDLRKYNGALGARLGRSGIPQRWMEIAETQCKAGQWIAPASTEETLDCLAAGFGGHCGSQFGSSPRLGADGLNLRTTSWNHDMAIVGYDLSCEIWRTEVVFVANSWGAWNDPNPVWLQHVDVLGDWIPGMLVVPLDVYAKHCVAARSIYMLAHIDGDAIKPLPLTTSGISGWSKAA